MGYSTRQLARLLRRLGYREDRKRGKGSHIRFYFEYQGMIIRATTLPQGKEEITEGLLAAVLQQVGLTKHDLDEVEAKRLGKQQYLHRLGLE